MHKQYVFAYGSLVNPEDLANTLGHPIKTYYPARLSGWVRDWSVVVDNYSGDRHFILTEDYSMPQYVLALNVRRPGKNEKPSNPNGVILEVEPQDLELLNARESHYQKVDVTKDITCLKFSLPRGSVIYTYTALDKYLYKKSDRSLTKQLRLKLLEPRLILPGSYMYVVEEAFATLGSEMHDEYLKTTIVSQIANKESVLV